MDVDDTLSRTFRLSTRHRNLGVVCLVAFVTFGVLSAVGMWSEVAPDRRHIAIYAVAIVVLFWCVFVLLAAWMLLAYWRGKLIVNGEQISQYRVLSRRHIDASSVTAARWRHTPRPGGSLVLRTLTQTMTICLGDFSPQERLWLIRRCRDILPPVQDGWELFCGKIALPLRQAIEQPHREPGSEMARITRHRWDWYFVPFILLSAVIGVGLAWGLHEPRMLVAPLLPTLPWIALRMATPREGLLAQRVTGRPEVMRFLVFEFCWLGVAVVGFVIFNLWQPPMPISLIVGAIAALVWFGVLFWRAYDVDVQRRARDEANAPVSARTWDERERAE